MLGGIRVAFPLPSQSCSPPSSTRWQNTIQLILPQKWNLVRSLPLYMPVSDLIRYCMWKGFDVSLCCSLSYHIKILFLSLKLSDFPKSLSPFSDVLSLSITKVSVDWCNRIIVCVCYYLMPFAVFLNIFCYWYNFLSWCNKADNFFIFLYFSFLSSEILMKMKTPDNGL